ncbi:hypothetical protein T484DRAFT_1799922, partial [Baffinella frigidus]
VALEPEPGSRSNPNRYSDSQQYEDHNELPRGFYVTANPNRYSDRQQYDDHTELGMQSRNVLNEPDSVQNTAAQGVQSRNVLNEPDSVQNTAAQAEQGMQSRNVLNEPDSVQNTAAQIMALNQQLERLTQQR